MSSPFWLTAFLDFGADEHDQGLELWPRLTGCDLSEPRGDTDEFVTLVPLDGDDYLRIQRLDDGPTRIHLDVHVPDPRAAKDDVVALGAEVVSDHGGHVLMTSPGGFVFCLVGHPATQRPSPTPWPEGHASFADQVCLDIPPSAYGAEFDFWHLLTGWERKDPKEGSEFGRLNPPSDQPLQLLLQRLDDEEDRVRAHLDWSSTDREAETARHLAAGAELVDRFEGWTVMRGPAGMTYCITRRNPGDH